MDEVPSSPPSEDSSPESALRWYKTQYEILEHELKEFQESSQELEAELERDVEAAEKRERALQEKAETLGFEVEEWKVCRNVAKGLSWANLFAGQIQAVQNRSRCRPEHFAEGNYHSSRLKPNTATKFTRHRSPER